MRRGREVPSIPSDPLTMALSVPLGVLAMTVLVACDPGLPDMCCRLTGSSICWPSVELKQNYTETGRYRPKDIIATRFQGWRDQMFVATPRLRHGVPFTLGRFDVLQRPHPCLQAFPSWDCPVHNAVDLFLDHLDLLWVLDSGVVDTLTDFERAGPPRVLAFNALTGNLVHSVDLSNVTVPTSRLQYLLVDYAQLVSQPWVYVSDATTGSIIAQDVTGGRGHRVVLPRVVNPSGPRDVLYLQQIRRLGRPTRVYLTYLGGHKLFSLTSDELRRSGGGDAGSVVDEGSKPPGFVPIGAVDNNLYFRYKWKPDIYMWNVDSTFKESNFLPVQEVEDGRLPTQVVTGYGGALWVLESNFQDYLRNTTGCLGANVLLHPLARN